MAEALDMTRPAASGNALLEIRKLEAWYGESHILHGVDIDVDARRGGDAAWPQRRRQDHHPALHHGSGRPPHRQHPL